MYFAAIVMLQIDSSYQDRLFETIVNNSIDDSLSDEKKIQKIVELTHRVMGPPRKGLFLPPENFRGIKDKYIHSSDIALIGGYACAMHSQVAGMLLTKAGFKFRFFSMMKEGRYHHVGEVLYNGKYIVVDPLFNQMFVNKNGEYAGADEIHKNWTFFKKQVGNKLIFKNHKDYSIDFYRKYYDYTPVNNGTGVKTRLMTKILGKDRAEKFITKIKLNKYLYWQIVLSIVYLFVLLLYILNYTLYYIYKKRFLKDNLLSH